MESRWRKHFSREEKSQANDYKKQANLPPGNAYEMEILGTLEDESKGSC